MRNPLGLMPIVDGERYDCCRCQCPATLTDGDETWCRPCAESVERTELLYWRKRAEAAVDGAWDRDGRCCHA